MAPDDENKAAEITYNYYLSLIREHSGHSFIAVLKKNPTTKEEYIIASFGLYATHNSGKSQVISCGLTSEPGRIRSEHWYFQEKEEVKRLHAKTFLITQQQAMDILRQVQTDSAIKRFEKVDESKIKALPDSLQTIFTEKEKEFYCWFRYHLNKNERGGPRYNGFNFNCHKYAVYILRMADIKDAYLERHLYLNSLHQLSHFKKRGEISEAKPTSLEFPESYNKIFKKYHEPIEGAVALLEDYCGTFFHPARHFKEEVGQALKKIKEHSNVYSDIESIVHKVTLFITPYRNYGGSLQRRLDYLEGQAILIKNQSRSTL